jgi:hypothetical protein
LASLVCRQYTRHIIVPEQQTLQPFRCRFLHYGLQGFVIRFHHDKATVCVAMKMFKSMHMYHRQQLYLHMPTLRMLLTTCWHKLPVDHFVIALLLFPLLTRHTGLSS